jgi:outer membrane protein assembly factor BamB
LYVSSLDHHAHIIHPADMSHKSVKLGGAAPSSPAVGKAGVYVGSLDKTIQFISANGGKKTFTSAEDWIWGSPVVSGNALYYADLKGNIISMDLASGKQNWVVPQKDDSVAAGLLIAGDRIYVAVEGKNVENGSLLALDLDGKIAWQKTPGGKLYSTPVAAGDLVLVAPYQVDSAIVAYDKDGKQAWTFAPEAK